MRLIFGQLDRHGILHGLLRYLVHHGIRLPVRLHAAAKRAELEWRRPCRETLQNLLHHPIYAGARRYRHELTDLQRKGSGRLGMGRRICTAEECLVMIHDRFPAYISWEGFQVNQQRLEATRARHDVVGTPRDGAALLKGLIWCGRCGRH